MRTALVIALTVFLASAPGRVLAQGAGSPTLTQDPAPAAPAAGQGQRTPAAGTFAAVPPDAPLASNLVDLEVSGAGGQRLGEIVDVVLGEPGAPPRAIVVAVAGTLGAHERHVALAPGALTLTRAPDGRWRAESGLTIEALRAAPPFTYRSGWNQ